MSGQLYLGSTEIGGGTQPTGSVTTTYTLGADVQSMITSPYNPLTINSMILSINDSATINYAICKLNNNYNGGSGSPQGTTGLEIYTSSSRAGTVGYNPVAVTVDGITYYGTKSASFLLKSIGSVTGTYYVTTPAFTVNVIKYSSGSQQIVTETYNIAAKSQTLTPSSQYITANLYIQKTTDDIILWVEVTPTLSE